MQPSSEQSDTPRVEAMINATVYDGGREEELDRMTDLARELERENARLREALEEIRDVMAGAYGNSSFHPMVRNMAEEALRAQ